MKNNNNNIRMSSKTTLDERVQDKACFVSGGELHCPPLLFKKTAHNHAVCRACGFEVTTRSAQEGEWVHGYGGFGYFRSNLDHSKNCEETDKRIKNIKNDVAIIIDTDDKKRVNAAIYRLYREESLTPKEISDLTGVKQNRINSTIGATFAKLCAKDTNCQFKKFL